VARNAREEKARARDAEMARLYRKHVLKEPDRPELVPLSSIQPVPKAGEQREQVGSFGD